MARFAHRLPSPRPGPASLSPTINGVSLEQNAAMALSIADEGYVMENGKIVLNGSGQELGENADIKEFYLGRSEAGAKKSFRDVKHYRRRKRSLS